MTKNCTGLLHLWHQSDFITYVRSHAVQVLCYTQTEVAVDVEVRVDSCFSTL